MARRKSRRGGFRPGAGRKPLPEAERRAEKVQVMLTRAERRALEGLARNKPISAYLYRIVQAHLRRRIR